MPPRKTATDKTIPELLNQELVPGATLTRVDGEFLAQDLAYGEDSFLSAIRRADGTVVPLGELTEVEQRKLAAFLEIEGATTLQIDLLLGALKAERLPSTLGPVDPLLGDQVALVPGTTSGGVLTETLKVADPVSPELATPVLDQRLAVDPAGGAARAINLPQTRDLEAEAAARAAAQELLERDNTFVVNRELLEHDGIPFTFGDEVVITDQREAVALLTIGAITRPAK